MPSRRPLRLAGRWGGRASGALCAALVWALCGAGAQAQPGMAGFRARAAAAGPAEVSRPAAPHYDVVALRVEFAPDTTRFTTGDGLFSGDLYGGLSPKVDPLPHDAGYFGAHLAFLERYVARVSEGRTRLTTHLLPEVVRLPRPMSAYSPTGRNADADAELQKLAALVRDAWALADARSALDVSGFDPERTAFVIFHAGVGRDIELTGTTLDRTPEDLPSLYFSREALARLGAAGARFKGLPVREGIVLPRTETRRGVNFITEEPFLAEFSINGLLAASFFNYLGVPDLYDTRTGESAVGPFSPMDPLGIFAYNGLFPPEPDAWTRAFLGWTRPTVLREGPATLGAVAGPGAEAARIDIAPGEYFLVENRYRDPEGDGLRLQVYRDGRITEFRSRNTDSTFTRDDISGFPGGVVVEADNYDWALPGGADAQRRDLNGGILIWHVDERRLEAGLPENRVNADPQRRALDLEEADGAQDIGFPSGGQFGPSFHLGTPFDYFYEGNPASVETLGGRVVQLYRNRFGPDTTPSSRANSGGPSFIALDGFSPPGPTMHFTYARAAEPGAAPDLEADLPARFDARSAAVDAASAALPGATLIYGPAAGGGYGIWLLREAGAVVWQAPLETLGKPARLRRASGDVLALLVRETAGAAPQLVFAPVASLAEGLGAPGVRRYALPEAAGAAGATLAAAQEAGQDVLYVGVRGTGAGLFRATPEAGLTRVDFAGEPLGLAVTGEDKLLVVARDRAEVAGARAGRLPFAPTRPWAPSPRATTRRGAWRWSPFRRGARCCCWRREAPCAAWPQAATRRRRSRSWPTWTPTDTWRSSRRRGRSLRRTSSRGRRRRASRRRCRRRRPGRSSRCASPPTPCRRSSWRTPRARCMASGWGRARPRRRGFRWRRAATSGRGCSWRAAASSPSAPRGRCAHGGSSRRRRPCGRRRRATRRTAAMPSRRGRRTRRAGRCSRPPTPTTGPTRSGAAKRTSATFALRRAPSKSRS